MLKPSKERTQVIYAGESKRREEALRQIKGIDVMSCCGGKERQTRNVLSIAFGKIGNVYPQVVQVLDDEADVPPKRVIVAADARTEIVGTRGKKLTYDSKGKPDSEDETRKNFEQLSVQGRVSGRSVYRVVASSAAQTVVGKIPERVNSRSQTVSVTVRLNQEATQRLSTPEGFADYLANFKAFYSSDIYASGGFKPITVTDISGGLSLPVLLQMGVVEQVGDMEITPKKVHAMFQSLKKAMLVVAVGFGPKILKEIDPSAYDQVLRWQWLIQATRAALRLD